MSACESAQEWLSAQLDGELLAEEASLLEAHLQTCPICQARKEQLALLDQGMKRALKSELPHPPAFRPPMSQLASPSLSPAPKVTRTQIALLALAACFLIVVGLFAPASRSDTLKLYLHGDGNLSEHPPEAASISARSFRSPPLHGLFRPEFLVQADAGSQPQQKMKMKLEYDFDGDGQIDRTEHYALHRLDDRPGWETYHHGHGLEASSGSFEAFRGGTLTATIEADSDVLLLQGGSYLRLPLQPEEA